MSAGLTESLAWKESSIPPDSSSSETGGKDTPPEAVHFTLGDGSPEVEAVPAATPTPTVSTSMALVPRQPIFERIPEDKAMLPRSHSQDANLLLGAVESGPLATGTTSSFLTKTSYSENSLEHAATAAVPTTTSTTSTTSMTTGSLEKLGRLGTIKKSLRDLPTVMSLDEETLSTDSNSTADNDELKRRRRKLHFPAFRKSKKTS